MEEGDADLKTFTIDHDREFKIPLIKRTTQLINDDLVFYASPWSPPAFMKNKQKHTSRRQVVAKILSKWGFCSAFNQYFRQMIIPNPFCIGFCNL
ncbi:hypothetical protein [Flavivirga sp. 57AJ16]|uniref:hypothetical protein n=1 Tax=Flavivirga sp. 57AJ16 TaxID=3025307 RepID=UPI0023657354|nr:hypothetical protein [Flavivirga sp. 57AJ16]MDD7884740.1 hypothetical protein [Flavivirga sp. 57AJ16]